MYSMYVVTKCIHVNQDTFQTVTELVNWLLIKFCCLNKIISSLEKTETCNLMIADYELYPLYLQTMPNNFATRSYTVIN